MNGLLYWAPYHFSKDFLLKNNSYKHIYLPLVTISAINKNNTLYDHGCIKKILSLKSKCLLNNYILTHIKHKNEYLKYIELNKNNRDDSFLNKFTKKLKNESIPTQPIFFNELSNINKFKIFKNKFINNNKNLDTNNFNNLLIKVSSGKKVWKSKLINTFRDIIANNIIDNCYPNYHIEVNLDYQLISLYPNNKNQFEEELLLGLKHLNLLKPDTNSKLPANTNYMTKKKIGDYFKFKNSIQSLNLSYKFMKIPIFVDYYLNNLNIYQKKYIKQQLLKFINLLNEDDFNYPVFLNKNILDKKALFYSKRRYFKSILELELFPELSKFSTIILDSTQEDGVYFLYKLILEKLENI